MNKVNAENAIKERSKDELEKRLNDLIVHEKELIARVKDLIAQQKILTKKRENVLKAIEDHKEKLKIVELDHKIQVDANEVMETRLKTAQDHLQKRKHQYDEMIKKREIDKGMKTIFSCQGGG